ncbi:hypothetical protein CQA53_11295 [Helicobacter didelphidarum]|uniref:Uncharacterized protein n=1 Tax=Helicobacter didelphidarum TaxID=2040648 RepID=A0A3D8I3J5_9HELI|nr:superinfection immunity protein [Helicobacter didelphidarum]RDU59688.1 hypothetical protein CQA53_11295 [Helicobacter didelphidarum]
MKTSIKYSLLFFLTLLNIQFFYILTFIPFPFFGWITLFILSCIWAYLFLRFCVYSFNKIFKKNLRVNKLYLALPYPVIMGTWFIFSLVPYEYRLDFLIADTLCQMDKSSISDEAYIKLYYDKIAELDKAYKPKYEEIKQKYPLGQVWFDEASTLRLEQDRKLDEQYEQDKAKIGREKISSFLVWAFITRNVDYTYYINDDGTERLIRKIVNYEWLDSALVAQSSRTRTMTCGDIRNYKFKKRGNEIIMLSPIWLLILFVYFLPIIIAFVRNHQSRYKILLLNLLLGTFIPVLVICLVWSCTRVKHKQDVVKNAEDNIDIIQG